MSVPAACSTRTACSLRTRPAIGRWAAVPYAAAMPAADRSAGAPVKTLTHAVTADAHVTTAGSSGSPPGLPQPPPPPHRPSVAAVRAWRRRERCLQTGLAADAVASGAVPNFSDIRFTFGE